MISTLRNTSYSKTASQSDVVMTACVALRWSSARTALGASRQSHCRQIKRYASESIHRNPASPIVGESDAPREDLGFHVDPANKTITTAIGDLPLSPIMDSSYWEAKQRHKFPKPKARKAQNSVERQFRKSPFAWALAGSLRQCTASKTRLPSFFLQDFNLIAHPTTKQPWFVPRSFAREQPTESEEADADTEDTANADAISTEIPTNYQDDSTNAQSSVEADEGGLDLQEPIPEAETPADSQAVQNEYRAAYGPAAYVLARQELIASFKKPRLSYFRHHMHLFGGSSSRYQKLASQSVWRHDMDSFILGLMRKDVVDQIIYLSKLCIEDSRRYIVKCDGWDDIKYKHNGALLWFNDTTPEANATPESDIASDSDAVSDFDPASDIKMGSDSSPPPGPFAVYNTTHSTAHQNLSISVAVHNMPMLLGPEETDRLKKEAGILADGSLFMLAGRRTIDLQLLLWKLQGYLVDYRELPWAGLQGL
ncbi:hypothetical protein GGS21DRAFT_496206 [Xylaria nigripes]|nr:hypothetical protein GGS21DRAFT_496206 [Xylaria nigripes]